MGHRRNYEDDRIDDDESSDDSDIQEVAIIPPPSSHTTTTTTTTHDDDKHPYRQPLKRRKISPQMDPIPTYNPTPIHILEQPSSEKTTQRLSESSDGQSYCPSSPNYNTSETSSPIYMPTPIRGAKDTNLDDSTADSGISSTESSSHVANDDYEPLLQPSPKPVGRTTVSDENRPVTRSSVFRNSAARRTPPANSASAFKPVSTPIKDDLSHDTTQSLSYAEEPVMWSPQLPSQIQPVKDEAEEKSKAEAEEDEYNKYKSPRITKQRVALKPTIPQNGQLG